ncbi:MAG: DUF4041 domain-containing protein [Planctomycetes bacterium]|nr:DUF4041 domain-containing protein [Planctomycetota bacterium]
MSPWIAVCSIVVNIILALAAFRLQKDRRWLSARFRPVIDIDGEVRRLKEERRRAAEELKAFVASSEATRARLTNEYDKACATHESLRQEIALLEENLEDTSFGLYKPHFSFDTAEDYKKALVALRDRQKALVRTGEAASCPVKWEVAGNAKAGSRMAKQNLKLVLRAFNGECDAAVAVVSWNNVTRMEERIRKAFAAINELGSILQVSITKVYLDLKLDEIRLAHEYEDKNHQEREEQQRIREQMREEEKTQREIEKASEDAERDEARFARALEQVRAEAAHASGEKQRAYDERIGALEAELEKARAEKERALSRAQLTKSGHVYVISNIGSFGDRALKVGMTRRLDPEDRVRELSDASVPFPFDIHAMIPSKDAPALEAALHQFLSDRRTNLVNPRKEFFEVALDEIEKFVRSAGHDCTVTRLAEAREYRETLARRNPTAAATGRTDRSAPQRLFERPTEAPLSEAINI